MSERGTEERMKIVRFASCEALYNHAVAQVARIGAEAIAERGRFLVALAGGTTPRPLYERLASPTCAIDWSAVDVFWTDERCVPAEDVRSNQKMAREALLGRVPIAAERIHPIDGALRPLDAADAYEVFLREVLGGDGRFDLVLLGVGADGHTASLFPRHQALAEDARWIVPVHVSADPPWRVTMTLPLIDAARHVLFLVAGAAKAPALRDLVDGKPSPASLVRPEVGTAAFLVDADAAALLRG